MWTNESQLWNSSIESREVLFSTSANQFGCIAVWTKLDLKRSLELLFRRFEVLELWKNYLEISCYLSMQAEKSFE